MRVLVDRRGEQGAVAIIVALCAVVLFGLSAFAVDFGMAYNSKRDLQKGADAAALAAAKELMRRTPAAASCTRVVQAYESDSTVRTAVDSAADSYAQSNRENAQRQSMIVRCSTDGKRVEVVYEASGSTPTIFGGIFGNTSGYNTARRAVADVGVASSATGLRPYFLCVTDLTNLKSGLITQIRYEKDTAACGTFPGNWYTANCPRFQGNGDLADYTLNGCAEEVKVIEPIAPSTSVTQAQVVQECAPSLQTKVPSGCLVSNPGNIASGSSQSGQQIVGAWDHLLTLPGITVPIFNQQWKAWANAANTQDCRFNGQGANGCYPIEALAGVKVCGYKWKNKNGIDPENVVVGSPCNGVKPMMDAIASNDQANYLWLRLINVQTTGSTKPSSCSLGDTCDAGARRTRLVE